MAAGRVAFPAELVAKCCGSMHLVLVFENLLHLLKVLRYGFWCGAVVCLWHGSHDEGKAGASSYEEERGPLWQWWKYPMIGIVWTSEAYMNISSGKNGVELRASHSSLSRQSRTTRSNGYLVNLYMEKVFRKEHKKLFFHMKNSRKYCTVIWTLTRTIDKVAHTKWDTWV